MGGTTEVCYAFRPMFPLGETGRRAFCFAMDSVSERVIFMLKRTIYCGAMREAAIGREETVCGWVQTKRDMGGVVFIDLRDREGSFRWCLMPESFLRRSLRRRTS